MYNDNITYEKALYDLFNNSDLFDDLSSILSKLNEMGLDVQSVLQKFDSLLTSAQSIIELLQKILVVGICGVMLYMAFKLIQKVCTRL